MELAAIPLCCDRSAAIPARAPDRDACVTTPQILSVVTLIAMMAMFIWGRFRYDVTACIALIAAVAIGIVPPADAFKGFSDDIVIIVASALVISAGVQRSGVIELALSLAATRLTRVRTQLLALTVTVGVASGLVKNVGALAMLMPAAFQMARKSKVNPSVFLMPMAFASLLGGLMTLVGTSPNIIVSRVREEMAGKPFSMFDYFPTGFGLLVAGLVFLAFGYRLIPRDRRAPPDLSDALDIRGYCTEASIGEGSPAIDEMAHDFAARHQGEVTIVSVLRGRLRSSASPFTVLRKGDTLILTGEPDALERAIAHDRLTLAGQDREAPKGAGGDEIAVVEVVVNASSSLIGQTAERLRLQQRHGVNIIAISRSGERLPRQLGATALQAGDVIVLQGPRSILPEKMRHLGLLPLADRALRLGSARAGWAPLIILAAAMVATATGVVPVAIAFFAAAGLIVVSGALTLRDAYDAVEWPILIMLAALIPVSDSLRATGASQIIATHLAGVAAALPGWGAVVLIMVVAMAVTPFLNNAATVMVMAPIAAVFAKDLGYRPEAFLIATAIGAGCDFVTPIGHQCNTLVFGPGGYKFADYARLGAPLSLLVVLVGAPLVLWVWPLH